MGDPAREQAEALELLRLLHLLLERPTLGLGALLLGDVAKRSHDAALPGLLVRHQSEVRSAGDGSAVRQAGHDLEVADAPVAAQHRHQALPVLRPRVEVPRRQPARVDILPDPAAGRGADLQDPTVEGRFDVDLLHAVEDTLQPGEAVPKLAPRVCQLQHGRGRARGHHQDHRQVGVLHQVQEGVERVRHGQVVERSEHEDAHAHAETLGTGPLLGPRGHDVAHGPRQRDQDAERMDEARDPQQDTVAQLVVDDAGAPGKDHGRDVATRGQHPLVPDRQQRHGVEHVVGGQDPRDTARTRPGVGPDEPEQGRRDDAHREVLQPLPERCGSRSGAGIGASRSDVVEPDPETEQREEQLLALTSAAGVDTPVPEAHVQGHGSHRQRQGRNQAHSRLQSMTGSCPPRILQLRRTGDRAFVRALSSSRSCSGPALSGSAGSHGCRAPSGRRRAPDRPPGAAATASPMPSSFRAPSCRSGGAADSA